MHQHALDDAVGSAAMLDNLFEIAGGVASISRRMSSASKATAGAAARRSSSNGPANLRASPAAE
jgi:hypothetical protein